MKKITLLVCMFRQSIREKDMGLLYEKLGYQTIKHEKYLLENDVILAYEVMEKELHTANTEVN